MTEYGHMMCGLFYRKFLSIDDDQIRFKNKTYTGSDIDEIKPKKKSFLLDLMFWPYSRLSQNQSVIYFRDGVKARIIGSTIVRQGEIYKRDSKSGDTKAYRELLLKMNDLRQGSFSKLTKPMSNQRTHSITASGGSE